MNVSFFGPGASLIYSFSFNVAKNINEKSGIIKAVCYIFCYTMLHYMNRTNKSVISL